MSARIYNNEKVPAEFRELERALYTQGGPWPNNFRKRVDAVVTEPFDVENALLRMKLEIVRRHEGLDERLVVVRQLLERTLAGEDVSVELAEFDAEAEERYADSLDRIDFLVAQAADLTTSGLNHFMHITFILAGTGVRGQRFWSKRQTVERANQRRIFIEAIRAARI